ncbi:MAG: glycosyltransferase family 4 protein [Oscillospiraceae bacterium]|nr:glycosyltransferase family 4 protein [Oscillospiraceae bacterium]
MKKTIWIVNQYASHLEERHLNLAAGFARRGCRTVVITSSFHHGTHTYLYDEPVKIVKRQDGVHFVYLKSAPAYRSNSGKRILNMLDFCRLYLRSQGRIASELGKPDFVIGSSAPPFMWEIARRTAGKYGAKFIAEFRDIWPQSLIDIQGVSPSHPLIKYFAAMEKRAYRRADAIVGTMPYAYLHVCDELGFPREKVWWMSNGIDLEKADRGADSLPGELERYLETHWCCIYIGSIVKSECVQYLVEAWEQVGDPEICFALIGDGNESPAVDAMIRRIGGDRIRHFGSIKKEQIPLALEKARCCVAAHPDYPVYRFGLSMNKLYDYLYSAKPVVFAFSADNVVGEAGGFTVPYGDRKAMAEAIERVKALSPEELENMGRRGKSLIREQYDYRVIADRYLDMLLSL